MMKRKLVLKRLSASDLTLFEHHYRNTSGAKQKALNLDVAVFVQSLYPDLSDSIVFSNNRIPLNLLIYGPNGAGLHNLQRKILKQQKNWRLNGELIYDPPEEPDRYSSLKKGDYAILEFSGDTKPNGASIYFITSESTYDKKIYQAIKKKYGNAFTDRKGMELLDVEEFVKTLSDIDINENHPLLDLIDQDILEDAVVGGIEGFKILRKRRKVRGVSQDEFNKARRSAELIGRLGEEILNVWLENQNRENNVLSYKWVSSENAIAPYDFEITENQGLIRNIDAKSTAGDFKNTIHISMGELFEMVNSEIPYDLYRFYRVTETSAILRIAYDLKNQAKGWLKCFADLPDGVMVDNISVVPSVLNFNQEIEIKITHIEEFMDEESND